MRLPNAARLLRWARRRWREWLVPPASHWQDVEIVFVGGPMDGKRTTAIATPRFTFPVLQPDGQFGQIRYYRKTPVRHYPLRYLPDRRGPDRRTGYDRRG